MKNAERQSVSPFRDGDARRRRSLIVGAIVICLFYLIAALADFFSPYDPRSQSRREPFSPPVKLRLRDIEGNWSIRPFVYPQRLVDPLMRRYEEDSARPYSLEFFAPGYEYKLFGSLTCNRHLFGLREIVDAEAPRIYLLGTDALGRDRFSRLIVAGRFSLLVGPAGALLAALIGIAIGCLAGYSRSRWGNLADDALMRLADAMMALPTLVMILAARAAFPLELPLLRAAALLIGIFVVLGWAEMARLTRGLVLELREREFVIAAISLGMSPLRIMLRHILPNIARPLIVQALLMLPAFMLAETALSFLGVGLQEPDASWGNLLAVAADVTLLERNHAWAILTPAMAITLFVLGVRMISNGLELNDE